jgi:hypothetical protein
VLTTCGSTRMKDLFAAWLSNRAWFWIGGGDMDEFPPTLHNFAKVCFWEKGDGPHLTFMDEENM